MDADIASRLYLHIRGFKNLSVVEKKNRGVYDALISKLYTR